MTAVAHAPASQNSVAGGRASGVHDSRLAQPSPDTAAGTRGVTDWSFSAVPAHRADEAGAVEPPDSRPLPPAQRRELEQRFQQPLGDVKIHTGLAGRRMTDRHGAVAVAKDSDIYFSPGAYAPKTAKGDHILRHEVAHVLQGRRGGGRPSHSTALEAEAHLAALTSGPLTIRGRARRGQSLLMKTYVATTGDAGYLDLAVRFYQLWENETATRVGSYQDVVTDLAKDQTPLSQFRIASHANGSTLFLPLLAQAESFAQLGDLGLQTRRKLALDLVPRLLLTSDLTPTIFGWLSSDSRAAALLTRLNMTATPSGLLKAYLQSVTDLHYVDNAQEPAGRASSAPAVRDQLRSKVQEAHAFITRLAAAELPTTATAADLDDLKAQTLKAFASAGWSWSPAAGELRAQLARISRSDTGAEMREATSGTFADDLKAVKKRINKKTHIEIRGCNIGKSDAYLDGIRAFFGTAPDALPSISAPMLYQFFGTAGTLVLPASTDKLPVRVALKFLFQSAFKDKGTAKQVTAAANAAGLRSVPDLANVLQHADIRLEFERWWQMKSIDSAHRPLGPPTLRDFQDFFTTGTPDGPRFPRRPRGRPGFWSPGIQQRRQFAEARARRGPRTFPLNAPGFATKARFFLILVRPTALPVLLAWVKNQGYSLPHGEDLFKRFEGPSGRLDPDAFKKAQASLLVDFLGDPYPVPTKIFFPEDPEYERNIRRLG